MAQTINALNLFKFYRIDSLAAETLRRFLAQILETYIQEGNTPIIINLDKIEFENLAQTYNDLLIGYRHPRIDSVSWRWRNSDATLQKLKMIFPQWQTADENPLPSLYEKNLS